MSGTAARVLTAVVLIPLVVWLVLWGPTWLVAIVVAGIILLALHEFFALGAKMNMPGYPKFTMFCAMGVVWAMAFQSRWQFADAGGFPRWFEYVLGSPEFYFLVFLIGVAVLSISWKRNISTALPSGAVSAAGFLFIAWPLSYLVRVHAVPRFMLFVLVLIWVGDTAAFFVGRTIGKHFLAPVISPKKTWEGAAANLLGSMMVGIVFHWWQPFPLVPSLIVAALVSIAGQVSDLFESAWKRGAGVKDSGSLLPGHGGVLDRIDALLLAAPVVWWYFSKVPLPK